MTLIRYQPLDLVNQLQQEVNRLFDLRRDGQDDTSTLATADWHPAVDIQEEDDRYVIHADVPGVEPDQIEITLEDGVLTLKGQRQAVREEEADKYKRVERVRGSFLRRFSLPDTVDSDGVSARSDRGVLEVVIPKAAKAQARKITVQG